MRSIVSCLNLCLDFANTLYGRGASRIESLRTFDDLLEWCVRRELLAPHQLEKLEFRAENNEDAAAERLERAIAIREVIYRIFAQCASGSDASPADFDFLNAAIALAPQRVAIRRASSGFAWQIANGGGPTESLLAQVLWSAGDLMTSKCLERVRLCANHKCLWLFLDDSLGGRRRWCSMSACGNRAKTQRQYLRRKAG